MYATICRVCLLQRHKFSASLLVMWCFSVVAPLRQVIHPPRPHTVPPHPLTVLPHLLTVPPHLHTALPHLHIVPPHRHIVPPHPHTRQPALVTLPLHRATRQQVHRTVPQVQVIARHLQVTGTVLHMIQYLTPLCACVYAYYRLMCVNVYQCFSLYIYWYL